MTQQIADKTSPLTKSLVEMLRRAGEEAAHSYRTKNYTVKPKPDGSPVTTIDLFVSEKISDEVSQLTGEPVISEETHDDDHLPNHDGAFWLLDPIDGTRDLVARTGEFCILLARIENGQPTHAVMYAPILRSLYSAERGAGAWKWEGEKKLPLPLQSHGDLRVALSKHSTSPELRNFLANNNIAETIAIGSALKFGLVAEGAVTVYPRFYRSREWDVAAGDLIVREAGGVTRDLTTGKTPTYEGRDKCFSRILCVANPKFLDQISLAGVS